VVGSLRAGSFGCGLAAGRRAGRLGAACCDRHSRVGCGNKSLRGCPGHGGSCQLRPGDPGCRRCGRFPRSSRGCGGGFGCSRSPEVPIGQAEGPAAADGCGVSGEGGGERLAVTPVAQCSQQPGEGPRAMGSRLRDPEAGRERAVRVQSPWLRAAKLGWWEAGEYSWSRLMFGLPPVGTTCQLTEQRVTQVIGCEGTLSHCGLPCFRKVQDDGRADLIRELVGCRLIRPACRFHTGVAIEMLPHVPGLACGASAAMRWRHLAWRRTL
jgi:hypothetical protein